MTQQLTLASEVAEMLNLQITDEDDQILVTESYNSALESIALSQVEAGM